MSDNPHRAAGPSVALSADETWLALLWLVDFGGGPGGAADAAWAGLAAATAFVVNGAAKLALIETRVRPLAEHLPPLAQQATALDLLTARHWFRNGLCGTMPAEADVRGDSEGGTV